jgi:hypothetical protein
VIGRDVVSATVTFGNVAIDVGGVVVLATS